MVDSAQNTNWLTNWIPQIELSSFGCDLVISSSLSPPAAHSPALPAARPFLFLLVGLRCSSNLLVYNPLLHASGTSNSLDGKCTCVWMFLLLKYVTLSLILQLLYLFQAVCELVCLVVTVRDLCLTSTFLLLQTVCIRSVVPDHMNHLGAVGL